MDAPLRVCLAFAVLTVVVLAGACGSKHATSAPPSGRPSGTVTLPTSSLTPASPTPVTASPPVPGRCTTAMLTARFRSAGPAAGHRYAFLTLTNRSGSLCRIYGFPGMQLVGVSGILPTRTVRMMPDQGLSSVRLAAGQSASATVHWSVVPAADEPQHDPCGPLPAEAWVTPPDEYSHLTVPWGMGMVCEHGTIWTTPFGYAGSGPRH